VSRTVIVGGFGTGRSAVESATVAFEGHYEEIFPYTFSDAISRPREVERAMEDADVRTVSAGFVAVDEALRTGGGKRKPKQIDAEGAPLPTTVVDLAKATLVKTGRMHKPGVGITSFASAIAVARFDISAIAELMSHPGLNIGNIGEISNFDSIEAARRHQASGILTTLIYRSGEVYFDPSPQQEERAIEGGVGIKRPEGEHDQLFITPEAIVNQEIAQTQEPGVVLPLRRTA
jgi:hypothetical protein